MKVRIVFYLIALAIIAVSCETGTIVKANLTWQDVDDIEMNDGWHAALYLWSVYFTDKLDYTSGTIETKAIDVGDEDVILHLGAGLGYDFTVVIFNDTDDDNVFDQGEPFSLAIDAVEDDVTNDFYLTVEY